MWVGGIIVVLIAVSIGAGFYAVDTATSDPEAQVRTNDPMMEILYSPLGNAVVLLVLQFAVANVLLFSGIWVWLRVRRSG
jgi:hypothetical protein